jgi:hypothetical protein
MKKYKICIATLLILFVFTVSGFALQDGQTHRPNIRHDTSAGSSLNWAGYSMDSSNYLVTDVKGSWVVPKVTCQKGQTQYSSFWVGIDGDQPGSNTVEQIGTDSDCSKGKPSYYTWYEFYPNPMHYTSISNIKYGDVMYADVSYDATSNSFTVWMEDMNSKSTAQYSTTVSNALRNSAEWINEAPSSCTVFSCTVLPLANFGTSQQGFDNTSVSGTENATINGNNGNFNTFIPTGSGATVNTITMVDNSGALKANPLPISTDGTSFSVKWDSSK